MDSGIPCGRLGCVSETGGILPAPPFPISNQSRELRGKRAQKCVFQLGLRFPQRARWSNMRHRARCRVKTDVKERRQQAIGIGKRSRVNVRSLPKARSWLEYPYYLFARYPNLQPDDSTGKQAFLATTSRYRQRLQRIPGILKELNESRRIELAALVADWGAQFQMWDSRKKVFTTLRSAKRQLKHHPGAIPRRLKKAEATIKQIKKYVSVRNPFLIGSIGEEISKIDKAFGEIRPPTASGLNQLEEELENHPHPASCDPSNESTRELYHFFVSDCQLARNEAEVRTGKIGNAFWNWNVNICEAGAHKGCAAIRQRIARLASR